MITKQSVKLSRSLVGKQTHNLQDYGARELADKSTGTRV